jgi:hypothetical protein
MKTKQVTQYRCEHCPKRGYSASHMSKHERRCTMNPKRECGMCAMMDEVPKPMEALLALLPDLEGARRLPSSLSSAWSKECERMWNRFLESANNAMPSLREATGNCPACIMAALRQAGIPVGAVESFDFTEECKAWWAVFNARQDVGAYWS